MTTRRAFTGGAAAAIAAPFLSRPALAAGDLVYWNNHSATRAILEQTMVPGFKQATGGVVELSSFDTNQGEPKILASWIGGQGTPDVVSVGGNNLPNYVHRKLAAPVDPAAFGFKTHEEMINSYEPGTLDGLIVDGKLFAIPMDLGANSLFYRRDFFKEVGLDPDKPPTTWEDVLEAGKMLTKRNANGDITRAGWGWEARTNPSHFYYWGTLLPQKGVDYLSKDGQKNDFNNEAGLEAFRYVHNTYHGAKISSLGLAPTINALDDFGSGLVAMCNAGLWMPPAMEKKYPAMTSKDGVYAIARLPQFRNGVRATRQNPWIWMVSSQSRMQKEAWSFVSWMTTPAENRSIWLGRAQLVQPRRDFSSLPEFKSIPFMDIFLEDVKIGVPLPRTPKFNELAVAVAKSYDQVAKNGENPEKVVPELARSVDRLLED